MKLAINQPAYLPWLGYLDRIRKADLFVVMDLVPFERGSFINRNRIKTQHGVQWITVPVRLKGHTRSTIRDIRIDPTRRWAENHLKQIFHAYRRAPRFFENFRLLEALYARDLGSISDLCVHQLMFWMDQYQVTTPLRLQPQGRVEGDKTDGIIQLCRTFEADEYLAGPQSREYLDLEKMGRAGIKVEFHDYDPAAYTYPQLWGDFVPGLSIVDHWMNSEENPWTGEAFWLSQPTQTTRPWDAEEPSPAMQSKETRSTS